MGLTLKEKLAALPDIYEKEITVAEGKLSVKIRRLTVKERDDVLRISKANGNGNGDDYKRGSEMSCKIVELGMIDPTATAAELQDMPAGIVEEISREIMNFNGWTVQGKAALADQFRPSA